MTKHADAVEKLRDVVEILLDAERELLVCMLESYNYQEYLCYEQLYRGVRKSLSKVIEQNFDWKARVFEKGD